MAKTNLRFSMEGKAISSNLLLCGGNEAWCPHAKFLNAKKYELYSNRLNSVHMATIGRRPNDRNVFKCRSYLVGRYKLFAIHGLWNWLEQRFMKPSANLTSLIESSICKLNRSLLSNSNPRSGNVSTTCSLSDSTKYSEANKLLLINDSFFAFISILC